MHLRRNQIHNFRFEIFNFKTPLCLCFSSSIQTRFAGLWMEPELFFKRLNETSKRFRSSLLQSISWWRVPGSNRWPPACKAGALPAELTPHRGSLKWWAKMDSNHRPHDYQSCALASWAIGPYLASTYLFRYIIYLYPLNWITWKRLTSRTDLRTLQVKSSFNLKSP